MRIKFLLLISLVFCNSFYSNAQYDLQYVDISTVIHNGVGYDYVGMTRTGNRVNAKYFGAKENGATVADRYKLWKTGRNIICVTSAGYMDNAQTPVGLTIDNGKLVNRTLESFDGLVVVYATGGIVVSNLKNADLTVQGGTIPAGTKLDLRNNPIHLQMFIEWAASQKATVFQTHLFVYKNVLDSKINNDAASKRERRFLAVGKNSSGTLIYSIVNSSDPTTLYEGTKKTLDFLNERKNINVSFMINLDAGAENLFLIYDEYGIKSEEIAGYLPIENASTILVFYYEE